MYLIVVTLASKKYSEQGIWKTYTYNMCIKQPFIKKSIQTHRNVKFDLIHYEHLKTGKIGSSNYGINITRNKQLLGNYFGDWSSTSDNHTGGPPPLLPTTPPEVNIRKLNHNIDTTSVYSRNVWTHKQLFTIVHRLKSNRILVISKRQWTEAISVCKGLESFIRWSSRDCGISVF